MKRLLLSLIILNPALYLPAIADGFDATIEWSRKVQLGVPVSGVIRRVDVDVGDRVTRGQLLVVLDDTPFQAAVDEAQAIVMRRQSERAEALRDYNQEKELYERTVASALELENRQMTYERAEAAYKAATARLARAQYDLRHTRLQAPFDGWVLARRTEPGQIIVTNLEAPTLLILAADAEYVARSDLTNQELQGLKVGGDARVTIAGRKYQGQIQSIGLEPVAQNAAVKRYSVTVLFRTPGTLLRAGQAARVEFP